MILKKPYAFFIKVFKPIHLLLAFLIVYLTYRSNNVLVFFNNYIYSSENVVGLTLKEKLISNDIYVIPIIIIIFSLIFLGIMFNKKKPVIFYVTNIFIYLIVIIINVYISRFLTSMEEAIVSIKIVKLSHDLILLNMIFQIFSFVLFFIRGLGINFKKFNFDSDITKLNINESDKEEIEVSINIDLDIAKSKRKRKRRYFKYAYKENKFIINLLLFLILMTVISTSAFVYFSKIEKNKEGIVYSMGNFNLIVNKSMFMNYGIDNEKITNNCLVVLDVSLQTNLKSISLFLKDFSLEVGEAIFHVETKYANKLLDIGNTYNQEILNSEYNNYIFIFEIPEKYMESDLVFIYNNQGVKKGITLNPKKYISNKIIKSLDIGGKINFNDTLGDISFSVNSFEIKDKFLINYNYCISENDCILSKEYITPTINENFDKHVLKLTVDYVDKSNLNTKSFYDFFSKFGTIEYKVNGKLYIQNSNFEQLKSKKTDNKNNIYIGVNSNITNADSIDLVFNIRDSKYTYILK